MEPMIRARCDQHGELKGRTRNYVRKVKPLSYPNDAVVCYMRDCENPAYIWLDEVAASEYLSENKRRFMLMGSAARIKVQ